MEVLVFLSSKSNLFFLFLYVTLLIHCIYDAIPTQRIVGDPLGVAKILPGSSVQIRFESHKEISFMDL